MKTIRRMLLAALVSLAAVPAAFALNGPGLGNLNYNANELYQRISMVDGSLGIPNNSNDPAAAFGLNLGYMYNGYFVGIFAPDHGHSSGGWLVLDVSDPRNPTQVARKYDSTYSFGDAYNGYSNGQQDPHFLGETGDFRENHGTGFSIQDGRFYAAIPTGYGVEIWDFTDVGPGVPPVRVTAFDIPNIAAGDYTNTSWQLTWQAPYLYVANANQGITVIDTSDINNLEIVSRTPISLLGGFRIGPIFAMGNHMIVSSMDTNGRVASIDISDPGQPQLLATYAPGQRFYAVCFNGSQVMFTNRGTPAYMQVVDISDPSQFVELSKNELRIDEALYCATQGDRYFSGNQEDVSVIDMSTPADPVLLGEGNLGVGGGSDHGQVSVFGNLVYIGNDHGSGNGFVVQQTSADSTGPNVTQVSPRDGATNQGLKSRIGLALADNALISSLDNTTFIVREQGSTVPLAGQYSGQADIVNFTPAAALQANTTYEVIVPAGGITDWSGNATDVAFSSTFTTGDGSGSADCTENCPIGGGTASASTTEAGHPASDGNDGDFGTRWTASSGSVPQWFQVDYGTPHEFSGAQLTFEFGGEQYNYTIDVSSDGSSWTQVADRSNNPETTIQQTLTFSPVTAQYMRVNFTSLPPNSWAALYEFSALQPVQGCNATGDEVCFVKLIADSEVNGEAWSSVAELTVLDNNLNAISVANLDLYDVDSEELAGEDGSAFNAIDNNPATFWHTEWQAADPVHPHHITLKLNEGRVLGGIDYLPRQNSSNGRIANYRVEVSADGNSWTQVSSGTFTDSASEQRALFDEFIAPLSVELPAPGAVEAGQSVQFAAVGDGGDGTLEYAYDFGDGSNRAFSTNPNASHSYTTAGHYPVIVTVRDASLDTATANRLQTVHRTLTAQAPTRTSSIVQANGRIYTANTDAGTVTAINASTLQVAWEVSVGAEPRTLAVANNGDVWVANQGSDSLSVLNGTSGAVVTTVDLPRGSRPYGVVFSSTGSALYVSLEASGELLSLDTGTGAQLDSLSLGSTPRGLAVSANGQNIYVTRFISPVQPQGEVWRVSAAGLNLAETIVLQNDTTTVDGEDRAQGYPNYLAAVTISPDGDRAWVPSQKVNTGRGTFLSGQALTFESTVRTIVSQIDLATHDEDFAAQFDFNDSNLASDAVFTPLGDYVFVALQANNKVELLDAYAGSSLGQLITDRAPKGLAISDDGRRLYVHNFMGRSVEVFDTGGLIDGDDFLAPSLALIDTVAVEALSASVLNGKRIFYNAADTRMALDSYITCASCHLGGDSDGRVWDFTNRGEGLRNTRSLIGAAGTRDGNVHWTANFDEIHDFENDIRNEFGGSGFLSASDFAATADPLGAAKAGLNADLDDLAAYVTSLNETPPSPYRNGDGSLTADAVAGQTLFNNLNCASCHSGDYFADGLRHDVGTIQTNSGQGSGQTLAGVGFDTPSLLGLWFKAPYLHNGQAATLADVLDSSSHGGTDTLTVQQRNQLASYLLQLEGPEALLTGTSRLQSKSSGRCADVEGAGNADGDDVLLWGCHNNANQRWQATPTSAGYLTLTAEHSGKCLDVDNNSTSAGANVQQWTCNGGNNQQWLPVDTGDGYFQLQSRLSGLCLGLLNNGTANGVTLEQQVCSSSDGQRWRQN
ncbi:RICIN domain-containing protein [Saccharospirillum mangrovi]|uniref:RICIN domain-containing protein n=1 Tax=Saccharospirillum mangrovi TaxID=2161747 RepID=UPI000D33ECA1|nr:RICIN domain-containing protein [Saccharospirillum mangrovi]